MSFSLTFLGTGTSYGVPVIGCRCDTCTSSDPRDKRTRHGALLRFGNRRLLVDTPPELRLQLLGEGVSSLDAVWFTHAHADHIHGIDDLREAIALYDTIVLMKVNRTLLDALANLERLGLSGRTIYVRRATTESERVVRNIQELSAEDLDYFSLLIIRR